MKTKTQLTMNLGRIFLGTIIFSMSNMAMATIDQCKTEARAAAKLIQDFNKNSYGYTTISASLVEENTEYDHMLTYQIEYINPETGDKYAFPDRITMQWTARGTSEEKCVLEGYSKGGA